MFRLWFISFRSPGSHAKSLIYPQAFVRWLRLVSASSSCLNLINGDIETEMAIPVNKKRYTKPTCSVLSVVAEVPTPCPTLLPKNVIQH